MHPKLFTVKEAATYLHCHPETIKRLLRTGALPGVKVGRRWKVPKAHLAAALLITAALLSLLTSVIRAATRPHNDPGAKKMQRLLRHQSPRTTVSLYGAAAVEAKHRSKPALTVHVMREAAAEKRKEFEAGYTNFPRSEYLVPP